MRLLGRPLTPDEMSFPSTIAKNDKGVSIISFQDWVKRGGDPDSLLKRYGYLPEGSEKQSRSSASKSKSNKPFEIKYSKQADPDALWLSCRLRRKLESHEVLYPRQIKEDDQGKVINWPSQEKVKQMFFPDPPKKPQTISLSSSKSKPNTQSNLIQTQPSNRSSTPTHSRIFGNKHLGIECTLNEQGRLRSKLEASSCFKEQFHYAFDAKAIWNECT